MGYAPAWMRFLTPVMTRGMATIRVSKATQAVPPALATSGYPADVMKKMAPLPIEIKTYTSALMAAIRLVVCRGWSFILCLRFSMGGDWDAYPSASERLFIGRDCPIGPDLFIRLRGCLCITVPGMCEQEDERQGYQERICQEARNVRSMLCHQEERPDAREGQHGQAAS
jgi:hypothetical protein